MPGGKRAFSWTGCSVGWPQMTSSPCARVGKGVEELRVRDASGAYRIIYLARLKEGVYVLHTFKKTTAKTAQADIELAQARLTGLSRR